MKKLLICLMLLVGSICFGMGKDVKFSEAIDDPILEGPVFISSYIYNVNNPEIIAYVVTDGYGHACMLDSTAADKEAIHRTKDPTSLPNIKDRVAHLVWMNKTEFEYFLRYSMNNGFVPDSYDMLRARIDIHFPKK